MHMLTIKKWLGPLLIAGVQTALAGPYTVTGAQTDFGFNPPPPVVPKITDKPANPSFTGTWNVDVAALSGSIAFAPYQVHVSAMLFKADLDFPAAAYSIVGGTVAYDPATLTLKLSDGKLTYTGKQPVCNGSSMICRAQPTPDMEKFDVTLTFADATLTTFKGQAQAMNQGGSNGNSIYTWSFNGQSSTAAPARDSGSEDSDLALRSVMPR